MTFMRSNSGIENYSLFFGCTCTVYIEGRKSGGKPASSSVNTFDEIFYRAILGVVKPEVKFVVKVVGSKNDVLAYASRIEHNDIKHAFVIVDKDHEGITSSIIPGERVVRTFGYSWENDFWTRRLCFGIVKDLTLTEKDVGRNIFYQGYSRLSHRLTRITKIDLLSKLHGIKYIPSNDSSVGLNIEKNATFGVTAKALRNLKVPGKVKRNELINCPVVRNFGQYVKGVAPEKIIRGHLWEHACIHLISNSYKEKSGEKSAPNHLIKNLCFSKFMGDPSRYLMRDSYVHYSRAIGRAISASIPGGR